MRSGGFELQVHCWFIVAFTKHESESLNPQNPAPELLGPQQQPAQKQRCLWEAWHASWSERLMGLHKKALQILDPLMVSLVTILLAAILKQQV